MTSQVCPICKNPVSGNPRYPNYVCLKCQHDYGVKNKEGLPIEFFNVDFTGGFMSIVNGVKGEEHECYINNVKCYANEARFGGIVIVPVE